MQDTACIGENLYFQNTSVNSSRYQWDFCSGDFTSEPVLDSILRLSNTGEYHLFITQQDSLIFGFYTSVNTNGITRLDFGTDINNIPTEVNIGDLGVLYQPRDIHIAFDGKNWIGFVANTPGNNIVRLNFGNSLLNIPSASILPINNLNTPVCIQLINENKDYYLIITNYGNNNLTIIDFGADLTSSPSASNIFDSSPINNANGLYGLSMIKYCDHWYGLASSFANGSLLLLAFDNGLKLDPASLFLQNINSPLSTSFLMDEGKYYGFISTLNGNIYKVAFGNSLPNASPVISQESAINNLSNTWALNFFKSGSEWKGFTIDASSGNLYRLNYGSPCNASIPVSNEINPIIHFNSPGLSYITLTATDSLGNINTSLDSIYIRNINSPDVSFQSNDNQCLSNSNSFNGLSSVDSLITRWAWDPGDSTGIEYGQNIIHQYKAAGTYSLQLTVQSANQCSNSLNRKITIYPSPEPDFIITPFPVCIGSQTKFVNSTINSAPDSITSYLWNLNNETSSSAKDTMYQFPATGTKTISLSITIPGCTTDTTKTIIVEAGPNAGFTFQNSCSGIPVKFTNTTTGNYSQVFWNFGDGYTSTLSDPIHAYDTTGYLPVNLTTSNIYGCVSTKTDTVTIFNSPVPGFQHDLPCINSPVTFYDTSSVAGANITGRYWALTNANIPAFMDTSSMNSPSFSVAQPGLYQIFLKVTSNFGCADSLTSAVNFLPGPFADFNFSGICLGNATGFTDLSSVPDSLTLVSWIWQTDSTLLKEENPSYKFSSAGNFPVTLTVKANNLCTNTISKTVTIHSSPAIGMTADNSCLNETSLFSDKTIPGPDSIITFGWQINNGDIFSGPEISTRFDTAGEYNIIHWVVNSENCSDTLTKTIIIYPVPKAAFTMTPSYGSPPLEVAFTNQSAGADSYNWNFGEKGSPVSSDKNPIYTYLSEGNFTVYLESLNQFGCSDSASGNIRITNPVFDIALNKITSFENNGAMRFLLDIANPGTVIVNNLNINISIDNQYSFTEPFQYTLYAGDSVQHLLNFQFRNDHSVPASYICFTLEPDTTDLSETDLVNNTACYTPSNRSTFIEPYPNPVKNELTVAYILSTAADIRVSLLNSSGKMLIDRWEPKSKSGYNELKLDLSRFNPGLYFLMVNGNNIHEVKKIILNR